MSYFRHFPFIQDYNVSGDKYYTGMDITRRTGLSADTKDNTSNYINHKVRNGETPEVLADRMYDDVGLYWVILMFNDIFDVDSEWPLNHISFERYVNRVHGSDLHTIRHYKSLQTGAIVDSDHVEYDRIPVTYYEYEIEVNDAKRSIKVPTPEAALIIKREHKQATRQ